MLLPSVTSLKHASAERRRHEEMIYRPQSIDLLIEDIRLHRDQVIISGRRQQETLILELHAAYFLHGRTMA